MASTKTLSNMLSYLRNILTAVEGGHWTQDELIAYLNTAQKDIAVKLPEKLLRGLASSAQPEVGEDTEIQHPTRYSRLLGGYRKLSTETRKRPLVEVDYKTIIGIEANAINTTSYDAYIADLGNTFYVYPETISGETIIFKYAMTPVDMNNSTDTISVDDIVYEWVIFYASALACLKDHQARANDFLTILNNKVMETLIRFNIKEQVTFGTPKETK